MRACANRQSPVVVGHDRGPPRPARRASPGRSGSLEQAPRARRSRNVMPMTEATPSASRASGSSASMRAPSTARSVTGTRGGPVSTRATRPSRNSSVPSSRNARTVSPTNSGLPPVRSWMLRAPSASTAARATMRRQLGGLGLGEALRVEPLDVRSVAQAGTPPGRVPARTTSGRSAVASTSSSTIGDARRIQPVQVVDDDDARPRDREQPLEVAGGDLDERRGDLGRVGRHVRRPPPPSRRTPRPGRWPRSPRRTGGLLRVEVVGEQQAAREGAGVDAVLVGDGLGEQPREAVWLAARRTTRSRSRSRRSPLRGRAARPAASSRDLPMPGLADDDDARRRGRSAGIARWRPSSTRELARPADQRAGRRGTERNPGTHPGLAAQRVQRRPASTGRAARPSRSVLDREPAAGGARASPRRAGSRPAAPATGCAPRS